MPPLFRVRAGRDRWAALWVASRRCGPCDRASHALMICVGSSEASLGLIWLGRGEYDGKVPSAFAIMSATHGCAGAAACSPPAKFVGHVRMSACPGAGRRALGLSGCSYVLYASWPRKSGCSCVLVLVRRGCPDVRMSACPHVRTSPKRRAWGCPNVRTHRRRCRDDFARRSASSSRGAESHSTELRPFRPKHPARAGRRVARGCYISTGAGRVRGRGES